VSEALRALAVLLESPRSEHAVIAAALELPVVPTPDQHTDVLVFQAYPYASVYLGAEGMLGGEARDRIAGFWRALGGEPPDEPDHLSTLLASVAALGDEATGAPVRGALFWEHVASWMPPYLATLRRVGAAFHVAWADLLAALLAELAAELGPPARLPLALRAAPALPAAPANLDELLATLLAPVRTGVVLVRDDLERAATELGLGLRAGERRFALRALLAQAPAAVLGWLAAEARSQMAALVHMPSITAWWAARARAMAVWLDELTDLARRGEPVPDHLAT
jgi:Nitrate reductase delta subunit